MGNSSKSGYELLLVKCDDSKQLNQVFLEKATRKCLMTSSV